MLIDSHTHIQVSQFDHDREETLQRATDAGVTHILIIGIDPDTSLAAVDLAEKYNHLYATVGMHPHNAVNFTSDVLSTFRDLLRHPKVIALGEIGLDYYRDLSPRNTQKDVFEKQLDLAEETGMPIIIHNRDAYDDILPILEKRKGKLRGVLHCFTGDVERMQKSLDIGFHIGIGGIVTYPKATDVQRVAREVPIDRLLIETDCPWLAPQYRRGKRNEPAYVRAVAERIAALRNTSVENIGKMTSANFFSLFGVDTT